MLATQKVVGYLFNTEVKLIWINNDKELKSKKIEIESTG